MGTIDDYKHRNAERESRKEDAKSQKGFGKKTFRNPDRMIRFSWWVATFNFLLVCVGCLQAWAFIQSERAFVAPSSMTFRPPGAVEKIAVLEMQIRNSGRSTANVRHNVYTISYKLADTPNYPSMTDVSLSPVVGGGFIQFQIKAGPLADNELTALSGKFPFFVYGRIDYEDDFSVFGLKASGWCFSFNPDSSSAVSQFNSCNSAKYTYSR